MTKEKKGKGKIGRITGILVGGLLLFFACDFLLFSEDEPLSDPPIDTPVVPLAEDVYIADVSGITVEETGVTYEDADTTLQLTPVEPDEAEAEIAAAAQILQGESSGKAWTAVTDTVGNQTVYIPQGKKTVKATVIAKPDSHGVEKPAAKAAALVQNCAAYTDGVMDYNENYATRYLEFADCILYYPAQLTRIRENEDNTLLFQDTRSRAALEITHEKNPYSCMDEAEGFLDCCENDTILAYGPAWYSSEVRGDSVTTYTYTALGEDYILTAELTYENAYSFVFEKLRALIQCKFVGNGIWVSEYTDESYYDETRYYNSRFSTKTVSYYCPELNVILLYPEMFSQPMDSSFAYAVFMDPLSAAQIYLTEIDDGITMKNFTEMEDFTASNVVDEHALVATNGDRGFYTYAYFGSRHVMASVEYPPAYAWVYENLLPEIRIIPAEDFADNLEMQELYYEDVGCRLTVPLQFEEVGFYDNVLSFVDGNTGIAMSVTFREITDNEQKTNLFACFDVTALDEDITLGENHIRWLDSMGFKYGVRGNYTTALLNIDSPNAAAAYRSALPQIKVEFVSEAERVKTAEAVIREKENPPETQPQPQSEPVETDAPETKKPETTKPETPETEKPETPKPPAQAETPLPIMEEGLGDLLSDEDSPLIKLLLGIDATQILTGEANMFRLIGGEDDITDGDVDMIVETVEALVAMGFHMEEEEEAFARNYVLHGSLNGRYYLIAITFEYTNATFGMDDDWNYVYEGPGEAAYLTVLTEPTYVNPGDMLLDYDYGIDLEATSSLSFSLLMRLAWSQRVVMEELKAAGQFDSDYVYVVRPAVCTEGEEWYIGHFDHYDQDGDTFILCYGKLEGGDYYVAGGYAYDYSYGPSPIDENGRFVLRGYDEGEAAVDNELWDPYDEVEEIYSFLDEYEALDAFFDAMEAELLAPYDFEDYNIYEYFDE